MKDLYEKIHAAMDRGRKARKRILHSDLPEKDRLQIADEILFVIDDLEQIEKMHMEAVEILWKHSLFNQFPFF